MLHNPTMLTPTADAQENSIYHVKDCNILYKPIYRMWVVYYDILIS